MNEDRIAHKRHSQKVTRTKRWKVLRMAVLERDGFACKACGARGRLEVDHIKPVRTHPELSFEPGNLQPLCATCHTRKTRLECGHPPKSDGRKDWAGFVKTLERGGKRFSIPDGLRPSAIPVFLVFGPPGAGKSTLIRQESRDGDVVVDFDVFLKSVGGVKWDTDMVKVRQAFQLRNAALQGLATRRSGRAWVIATAPSKAERRLWKSTLLRATEILLAVDPDTCKARIRADPDRQHAVEKMCAAVDQWWRTYAAESGQPKQTGDKPCLIL